MFINDLLFVTPTVQNEFVQFLPLIVVLVHLIDRLILMLDEPKLVGGTELTKMKMLATVQGIDGEDSRRQFLNVVAPVVPIWYLDNAGVRQQLHPAHRNSESSGRQKSPRRWI